MLTLNSLSYIHANGDRVFDALSLTINTGDKVALIGNNGAGKSTLLKIMNGLLLPSEGTLTTAVQPFYIPQHVGQFNHLTVAQAMAVDGRLKALYEILNGEATERKPRHGKRRLAPGRTLPSGAGPLEAGRRGPEPFDGVTQRRPENKSISRGDRHSPACARTPG